jgi:dienelactone hydrolase
MKRLLLILGVVAVCVLALSSVALAGESARGFYPPDQLGPYSIGHTTATITDTTRNLDGSTPATAAGRFLHLDIWYPTTQKTTAHVFYTWNNPLYNQNPDGLVYPGLPDLPALTAEGSRSLNPVLEKAPLAGKGKFPLLVASHGNLVSSAKNMPDTLEALASYGYVVASVEHTGNDDAYYQTYAMGLPWAGGLNLGPNPSISETGIILQRTKDVSFVIDSVLEGVLDQQGAAFSDQVNAKEIGVLGYSLGGQTSLATVTGIGSAGYPADRRVKAAFMDAGSNWGLLLKQADYANAKVPLMFFGNDTGMAYESFNQFTGSHLKYRVDVADFNHHVGGYESSWAQDFHNSMVEVNPAVPYLLWFDADPSTPSPTDIANWVFDSTFYFTYTGARQSGVWDYCDPSVFDGISDPQLVAVNFLNQEVLAVKAELLDKMPLKPEATVEETARLTNWYAVSFFNKTLKHEDAYSRYLNKSVTNQRINQLVEVVENRQVVRPHPIDLLPKDKITFDPAGSAGYDVSVTSGVSPYDMGEEKLGVEDDGVATLSYSGFEFPVPGMAGTVKNLIVNENGVISTLTSPDINGIDDNGTPWYMKGHLLMSGQFTIGALMKNLDAAAAGGVYGYYDAAQHRVVITYSGVPAVGTTAPNTLQIAIYADGKIEMIVGELASTGASFSPGILGTVGLAGGHTKMSDLRSVKATDFSSLRDQGPVFMPFGEAGAIFEQFNAGTK